MSKIKKMISKLRDNIWFLLGIISVSIIITILSDINYSKYRVIINYCDGRPKKTMVVEHNRVPSNEDISTYKQALPRAFNEVNVCDIETIEILR